MALGQESARIVKLKIPPLLRPFFLAAILAVAASATGAKSTKEWVTLNDCHYVDWKDNDGDSFHVRAADKEFTARLYYADAPETTLRYAERTREQSVHFGITLDETLKTGEKAKARVHELLQKPFTIRTRWANAGGRGYEGRYYVIVEIDGKSLAEILIGEGLARVKGIAANPPGGEKSSEYMRRLDDMEAQAREKRLGAWSASAPAQPVSEDKDKPE